MGQLVDYSSSEGPDADEDGAPTLPTKRRKLSSDNDGGTADGRRPVNGNSRKLDGAGAVDRPTSSSLPPLPDSFHDLYATNVRSSVIDDPTLHQGRKRFIPHKAGNWPSHLYIEWHPTPEEHTLLSDLLDAIRKELAPGFVLNSFLSSDLGAPLPLHISLSRPIMLRTETKDDFLTQTTRAISSSGTHPFDVHPANLGWFKSPDSDRTFLVLRVFRGELEKGKDGIPMHANRELAQLLGRCNEIVAGFGQPALYQTRSLQLVEEAFHVSIGWSFALPPEKDCLRTYQLFKQDPFKAMREWKIRVEGVKAKIGNVVTHIPLPDKGRPLSSRKK